MNLNHLRIALSLVIALCTVVAAAQTVGDGARGKTAGSPDNTGAAGSMPVSALDGWLISRAEAIDFRGEEGFNEPAALRPRALMPLIDILRPAAGPDNKVTAPFPIAVAFRGLADAPIDPNTFKVMYGALKIDITGRITKFVRVSKDGFTLENAQIPPGKHRLILQVQDEKQRVAERELRVEVE